MNVPRAALGFSPGLRPPERSAEFVQLLENHSESYPGKGGFIETRLSGCAPQTASFPMVDAPCPWKLTSVAARAVAYIQNVRAYPPAVGGILDES